jgi:hypothetical protein
MIHLHLHPSAFLASSISTAADVLLKHMLIEGQSLITDRCHNKRI